MTTFNLATTDAEVRELTESGNEKIAEGGGLFVAQKIRERGFGREILTNMEVNLFNLRKSEYHDQLEYLAAREANVGPAKAINFRAEPDAVYITESRFAIPIFELASELFEKREIEFLAMIQPIAKVVEDNNVREIERTEDIYFLRYADATASNVGNLIAVATGSGGRLTKGVLTAGIQQIIKNQLICATILMSAYNYQDIATLTYQDLGSGLMGEVVREGYKYGTLLGKKVIASIKDELFRHPTLTLASGEPCRMVYFFAEEKALGYFLSYGRPRFAARRVFTLIQMQAWEYIGIGFGGGNAICRVTMLD
jgi:hypothetical protein